ncbi:hypothetical protein D515_03054 [Grimontia indica]|uniref:Uncharacterized protein n=1 Tax=Grimontia indica TaxID=1056512 RepID=R1ILA3_9GAMM|nr:hypothetical protein D515_03054 [Grimontia indica]
MDVKPQLQKNAAITTPAKLAESYIFRLFGRKISRLSLL